MVTPPPVDGRTLFVAIRKNGKTQQFSICAPEFCARVFGGSVVRRKRIHEMTEKVEFRRATRSDLPDLVRMLADDDLGRERESCVSPLLESYHLAFDAIDRDSNNELVVAESAGQVVGMLQLTFIPYLTYRGSWRALIEGVRVDRASRSLGIGRKLLSWAIERAKQRRCRMVQLTSDRKRPEAIRFYEQLGFASTHEGLKLQLPPS